MIRQRTSMGFIGTVQGITQLIPAQGAFVAGESGCHRHGPVSHNV